MPDPHSHMPWCLRRVSQARCAKCPCINDHLSGAKKVQQVLANPGTIERFVADAGVAKALRSTFMGMYTLTNDAEGDAAAKLALARCARTRRVRGRVVSTCPHRRRGACPARPQSRPDHYAVKPLTAC